MPFTINHDLLAQARAALSGRDRLYWIVGGAGSGKTTICRALSDRFDLPVYDMDAHIYGAYHGRFRPERHPVNCAWSAAADGLAWLLGMSWDEFDGFNRAALPEYLDLLAEDLVAVDPHAGILIDGGICTPALAAQAIAPRQMACLAVPHQSSVEIWEANAERLAMKDAVDQLPQPGEAWRKFLEFDERITRVIVQECRETGIAVCSRSARESIDEFAARVAGALGLTSAGSAIEERR